MAEINTDATTFGNALEISEDELEEMEEEYFEELHGFRVSDDQMAEWCLNKMREADQELAKWTEHYKNQIERLKKRHDSTINTMTTFLHKYFNDLASKGLAKTTKTKSTYKLPSGTMTIKKGSWKYERDDEKLVNWLKGAELDNLVKIVEKPDWASLKKGCVVNGDGSVIYLDTGEMIDGVTATMSQDEFVVDYGQEKEV